MTDSKDWGAAIHNHYGEQLHKLQEETTKLRDENEQLRLEVKYLKDQLRSSYNFIIDRSKRLQS